MCIDVIRPSLNGYKNMMNITSVHPSDELVYRKVNEIYVMYKRRSEIYICADHFYVQYVLK